ncbi:biotin/lipoyl-containing protein [Thermogladius sp. 4427co]|uniref:biotin/lipoyl-containing protein n=1 Tax=Thermogladius sp. 4427co TaxID=3450718 RepID=UPI003F79E653
MPKKIRVKTVYGHTFEMVIDKIGKDRAKVILPDGKEIEIKVVKQSPDRIILDYDGVTYSLFIAEGQAYINIQPLLISDVVEIYESKIAREKAQEQKPVVSGKVIKAPIAGRIIEVKVNPGDKIKQGDVIALMESMKMIIEIKSHLEGEVAEVYVKKGQSVQKDTPLVSLK